MRDAFRSLTAMAVLPALVAGAAVLAQPAQATTVTGKLTCTTGSSTVHCLLRSVGLRVDFSNQHWKLDGVAQPAFDFSSDATFGCTPGSVFVVSVQYSYNGSTQSTGTSGTCS